MYLLVTEFKKMKCLAAEKLLKKVLFNKTEGFNNSIIWEESLNSWVIVNNQTAKIVLNSSDFTANRKRQFIDKLDASYEQKLILKDFYSNWLMNMEGDDHKSLRKKIQNQLVKLERKYKKSVKKLQMRFCLLLIKKNLMLLVIL